MSTLTTRQDVLESSDVDALWQAFTAAAASGDDDLKAAARSRMAELEERRRMDDLDDDTLLSHIATLRSDTATPRLVDAGGSERLTDGLNDALAANVDQGRVAELRQLEEEARRRNLTT